ncbi:MAG TPA: hypothetical protein VEH84_13595, partial [Alphaproteobacteria bacterium]|nr:hypothetical protein [Alphaproteobacteria bacterium]
MGAFLLRRSVFLCAALYVKADGNAKAKALRGFDAGGRRGSPPGSASRPGELDAPLPAPHHAHRNTGAMRMSLPRQKRPVNLSIGEDI